MKYCLAIGSLALVVASLDAAPRRWQTGTWTASADQHTLVIETADVRLELQEPTTDGSRRAAPPAPAPGTRVTFAIESGTLYVRDGKGAERPMRVVRTVEKKYNAVGGGHLLKAVAEGGRVVTLEDGSIWEVNPSDQFKTAHWEPGAVMGVVRLSGDEYGYELDNIDIDEGAQANYQVKR